VVLTWSLQDGRAYNHRHRPPHSSLVIVIVEHPFWEMESLSFPMSGYESLIQNLKIREVPKEEKSQVESWIISHETIACLKLDTAANLRRSRAAASTAKSKERAGMLQRDSVCGISLALVRAYDLN